MNETLKKKLNQCSSLPSPPKVAEKIIELSQSQSAGAREVGMVVNTDVGLVAKVLQVANSPFYFRGRSVENMSKAVVLLGLKTVLNLALSLSLVSAMRKRSTAGLDLQAFWRRSLTAATAARALCPLMGASRADIENFFLASLLQDVGMLALSEVDASIYRPLGPAPIRHEQVIELEREQIGTDHAAVGTWLLQRWNLPDYLRAAIAHSHDATIGDVPAAHASIARCTMTTGHLAEAWLHAADPDYAQAAIQTAAAISGLSVDKLQAALTTTAELLSETSRLFDFDLGSEAQRSSALEACQEALAA